MTPRRLAWVLAANVGLTSTAMSQSASTSKRETLQEIGARLGKESKAAYEACRFSALSKDYFARFGRDASVKPAAGEIMLDADWRIVLPTDAGPLTRLMAGYLGEFLAERMGLRLPGQSHPQERLFGPDMARTLVLADSGGGSPATRESFTLTVRPDRVIVRGRDANGLRDGIVKLVERIGLNRAPILRKGETVYTPRLVVRLGTVPWMGSHRDLVFMGYNACFAGGGNLHALSTSDAIPELTVRRVPGLSERNAKAAEDARRHGLRTYSFVNTRQKFPKDDPVFAAHPDIRGALTWKADGEFVLCTEHPLVKRYIAESVEGVFRDDPKLDGMVVIIGGEGFYHCYMRPYGVKKGRTNCKRCDKVGAERVVANLCNLMAEAARRVNPRAEIIAWPYSAEHVWSADKDQALFISQLRPGTAIHTEMEKSEYVAKPEGVNKHLWDYSIDMIGPGPRAKSQIAACKKAGISIYVKSEPELGFEAPRLPHIPCLDRWVARAEAMASCGATGAWVFPAFRRCYGTSAAESYKLVWWDPVPDPDEVLAKLAARIAGPKGAPHLRKAWTHVSEAIDFSPELPPYYTGPYYLGPAHPMCADPKAKLPDVFYGLYLFHAEITDADGLKKQPTFNTSPRGNVPVFGRYYRKMEGCLAKALAEIEAASRLVADPYRLTFDAEASPVRWFHHTARTQANFYESCQLRDRLLGLAGTQDKDKTPAEQAQARKDYARWREVLLDEKANTAAALPVVQGDMRLDCYYGGDHTFPHAADMIRAKLEILDGELATFLPSVAKRCGIE